MTRHRSPWRRTALIALTPALIAGALQTGSPVHAQPAKPADLSVTTTSIPVGEVRAGGSIVVASLLTNAGRARSRATTVRYYLSTDKAPGKEIRLSARQEAHRPHHGDRSRIHPRSGLPPDRLCRAEGQGQDHEERLPGLVDPSHGARTLKGQPDRDADLRQGLRRHQHQLTGVSRTTTPRSTCGSRSTRPRAAGGSSGTPAARTATAAPTRSKDDIMGDFGAADHSEFDLLVGLRYSPSS